MKNILIYIIKQVDNLLKKYYPKDNHNYYKDLIDDYQNNKEVYSIHDLMKQSTKQANKDLYLWINTYYNQVLSELLLEWDYEEISKLKYLWILLWDIKTNLDNNNNK